MKEGSKEITQINVSGVGTEDWLDEEDVDDQGKMVISILETESGIPRSSKPSIFGVWKRQKDGTWRLALAAGTLKDHIKQ